MVVAWYPKAFTPGCTAECTSFARDGEVLKQYDPKDPANRPLFETALHDPNRQVAQRAEKLMTDGGSLLTLTYYGAEKWMPHYNVMGVAKAALEASVRYLAADLGQNGIRVNAIGPGPTLPSKGQSAADFEARRAALPLGEGASLAEVCAALRFLIAAPSVTGQMIGLDGGDHLSRDQPAAGTTRPEGGGAS